MLYNEMIIPACLPYVKHFLRRREQEDGSSAPPDFSRGPLIVRAILRQFPPSALRGLGTWDLGPGIFIREPGTYGAWGASVPAGREINWL